MLIEPTRLSRGPTRLAASRARGPTNPNTRPSRQFRAPDSWGRIISAARTPATRNRDYVCVPGAPPDAARHDATPPTPALAPGRNLPAVARCSRESGPAGRAPVSRPLRRLHPDRRGPARAGRAGPPRARATASRSTATAQAEAPPPDALRGGLRRAALRHVPGAARTARRGGARGAGEQPRQRRRPSTPTCGATTSTCRCWRATSASSRNC